MTASWITQVSMEPALVGVGIDNKSVTYELMNKSDYFTINMFSPEYTKVFVKFSKVFFLRVGLPDLIIVLRTVASP